MDLKTNVLTYLVLVLLDIALGTISQDRVCVSYKDIRTCSMESTWVVDTPTINITHTYEATSDNDISYYFAGNMDPICRYQFKINYPGCISLNGKNCVSCHRQSTAGNGVIITAIVNIGNMDEEKNQSNLTYTHYSTDPKYEATLLQLFTVSECESTATKNTYNQDSSFMITSNSTPVGLNAEGTCHCPKKEVVFVNGKKSNPKATCAANATWIGCEKVQCWSGPQNITSVQFETTVNAYSPFGCNFTEGFPYSTSSVFKIDGEKIPDSYSLNSEDHGKKLSCEVVSNYTKQAGNTSYESVEPYIIVVHFPPKNSTTSDQSPVIIKVNNSKELNYSVFANPRNGYINVTVKKINDLGVSPNFRMIRSYNSTDTLHIYEYLVTVSSDKDYGSYEICASTEDPFGKDCANLSICNFPLPTSSQPDATTFPVTTDAKKLNDSGIPAAIIGAIVAGAILIVLIVAVVYVLWKRRRKAHNTDHGREERLNELYGSAQCQTPATDNPVDVKQETANVLYESSSGAATGDVVEYAMASPDGIVSDDIVEYATSNPDVVTQNMTESTSATEQPCSSTADVYAQIDKKKGKVNRGYNKETPDAKADTSTVTYTVVDKPKKRKKDDVPEVYATVNKPRTKG